MPKLRLCVISLRYSSWSIRALLPLWHANAEVEIDTAVLDLTHQGLPESIDDPDTYVRTAAEKLKQRRALGSITGHFPVLWVDDTPIHEALSICEWAAEHYPDANLWPQAPLERAKARSLSLEMASSFPHIRTHMSSHPFAHVPSFSPDGPTRLEIARVFELLTEALEASGGPFLFGDFGIVDAMYFPMLMRFTTYGIPLPDRLRTYDEALQGLPAVVRWREIARAAPRIPVYDAYIEALGGEVG